MFSSVSNLLDWFCKALSPRSRVLRTLLLGSFLLLNLSCALEIPPLQTPVAPLANFSLFLQPIPQEAHRLSFRLAGLLALAEDGSEVPITLLQERFSADDGDDGQKKLAFCRLPPGRYLGLALQISAASQRGEDGAVNLLPPQQRLVVDHPFLILEDRAETLFLSLSPERLVTDGVFFTPSFSLWQAERVLSNLKGFVSNGASQSLTVFNKRTIEVLGTIQVGKGPRGMVLDQLRGWLYVALAEENAIAVVDVNNGLLLGRIPLRFGDLPTKLALSASGDLLLVLNLGSDSVSVVNARAFYEIGRIRLVSQPSGLFFGAEESRGYVTLADANSLATLDLQALVVRHTKTLDDPPLGGVVSADGRSLCLINDFSPDLVVLDAASLVVRKKIYIGNGALSVEADRATGLLYIGKRSGEIVVVDLSSALSVDQYLLTAQPVESMAIDKEENALFTLMPQGRLLMKVDLIGRQELGRITLEPGSHTVVVMGSR